MKQNKFDLDAKRLEKDYEECIDPDEKVKLLMIIAYCKRSAVEFDRNNKEL